MFIIKYKWMFLTISAVCVLISIFFILIKGVKKGIDFTGGTIIRVEYNSLISKQDGLSDIDLIKNSLEKDNFLVKEVSLLKTATSGLKIIEIKLNGILLESERLNFEKSWSFNHDQNYKAKQISENTVGPNIGKEFTQKAVWSVLLVIIFIVIFVSFSFREVSRPVASWKYGFITIIALIHDAIIPTGVYAFLGEKYGYEIDSLFVVAILTIMGISISDTIVVFDRIRENLKKRLSSETFAEVVGKSLSQTLGRSLNTSLAVIIVLLSLYYFGPVATNGMTLVLVIGMIVGTYSSIFIASPLLVLVEKWQKK